VPKRTSIPLTVAEVLCNLTCVVSLDRRIREANDSKINKYNNKERTSVHSSFKRRKSILLVISVFPEIPILFEIRLLPEMGRLWSFKLQRYIIVHRGLLGSEKIYQEETGSKSEIEGHPGWRSTMLKGEKWEFF
jgi:hypothetical protein